MLPDSPRTRRRLFLVTAVVVIAGSIAAIVTLIPSHAPSAPGPTGNEGPAQLASATGEVKLTKADRRAIDSVLNRFLPAAMERRDPALGWKLAGPEMKSGSSLAQWRKGNSPVPYYQASEKSFDNWEKIDAGPGYVIFNLLVHPAKGSTLAPYVFSGEVVKQHGQWLVNRLYTIAIMNKPSKHHQMPEVGPADFGAGASAGASGTPDTSEHKSRIVPVLAILAAIVLVPLLIGGIALRRWRRFRRQTRAQGRREIPGLPSRYRSEKTS